MGVVQVDRGVIALQRCPNLEIRSDTPKGSILNLDHTALTGLHVDVHRPWSIRNEKHCRKDYY
jgi:hypothetical protein